VAVYESVSECFDKYLSYSVDTPKNPVYP